MKKLNIVTFILAFTLIISVGDVNAQCPNKKKTSCAKTCLKSKNSEAVNKTVSFKVSAYCATCKEIIEEAMANEDGIVEINVDTKYHMAKVTYDPKKQNPEKIKKAISELGFNAGNLTADKNAFNKLPKNCRKHKI